MCSHSVVKLHEATEMFMMVDYVMMMTVQKSYKCKYGDYALFEHLLFLLQLVLIDSSRILVLVIKFLKYVYLISSLILKQNGKILFLFFLIFYCCICFVLIGCGWCASCFLLDCLFAFCCLLLCRPYYMIKTRSIYFKVTYFFFVFIVLCFSF